MKRKSKNKEIEFTIDLRQMEEEVLAEGREWMRRRMEEKLTEAAKKAAEMEKKTNKHPKKKTDS